MGSMKVTQGSWSMLHVGNALGRKAYRSSASGIISSHLAVYVRLPGLLNQLAL